MDPREHSIGHAERAELEALLEGVALPATRSDIERYLRRYGGASAVRLVKDLPRGRYSAIDEVGEALVPVQPERPRAPRVPRPESDAPPGGDSYVA